MKKIFLVQWTDGHRTMSVGDSMVKSSAVNHLTLLLLRKGSFARIDSNNRFTRYEFKQKVLN